MLFQRCQPRFNPGCGRALHTKHNPCKYDKKNNNNSNNNNTLKANMIFCMIPKPRCSSCN